MSKILAHVPHASVESRVWSFVIDQRKRIPQYTADGQHAYDDAQADAAPSSRSPEAQCKINGSPMLHPRFPLDQNNPRKRVEPQNTNPANCQSGVQRVEPKKPKAKLPKLSVKNEHTEDDADEHAARLTERRERRRARREILKPKETLQDEDCESNISDEKARKKKLKTKKSTALPAGLALMNSFSSKNVTRDRLTLRSEPRGVGMFNKGKASAKVKTRASKPAPRAFDEYAFLNQSRARIATSSDSESSSPAIAPVAQRSRFFQQPAKTDAEEPVRKKQHAEQQHEREADSGSVLSDDKPAGPVSAIWSIEREFLEPEATQGRQETVSTDYTSPHDTKLTDDIRSVRTMNTQYRLRLPMCADIAAFNYAAQPQPFLSRMSPMRVAAAESSYPAFVDEASDSNLPENDAPAVCGKAWQHSFPGDGSAEDAASQVFSPHVPPDPHSCETHPAGRAGRAASCHDESSSGRLLDDLDYLLEKHQQLLEATRWVAQDCEVDAANDIMDAHEDELLSCDVDAADTWTNGDGDGLFFDPAPAHLVDVDARYEPLLPDENRVVWNAEMGRFMTTAQEERVVEGAQHSDWQFENSDAQDLVEDDQQDYSPDIRQLDAEEMLVDERSDSSLSEVEVTSIADAASFTEGRSLLLGLGSLGSRPTAQDIHFEWHPYRLG